MTSTQTAGQSGGVGSPISNEAYNVITALQAKLEGLEAYRKYQQSGGRIWTQLSDMDNQAVQILTQELERLVQEGQVARVPTAGGWGLPCQERGPLVAAHEEASHGYTASVPTAQAYLAVVSRGSSANQRIYSE